MRTVVDPTISKYPFQDYDEADLDRMAQRVEDITLQLEHLEEIREAMEYDEHWKIISEELGKRLHNIAINFFSNTNPSDPNVHLKYATAWGQFNEIIRLTERQLSVTNQIEKFKKERLTMFGRIEAAWSRLTRKTRKV